MALRLCERFGQDPSTMADHYLAMDPEELDRLLQYERTRELQEAHEIDAAKSVSESQL